MTRLSTTHFLKTFSLFALITIVGLFFNMGGVNAWAQPPKTTAAQTVAYTVAYTVTYEDTLLAQLPRGQALTDEAYLSQIWLYYFFTSQSHDLTAGRDWNAWFQELQPSLQAVREHTEAIAQLRVQKERLAAEVPRLIVAAQEEVDRLQLENAETAGLFPKDINELRIRLESAEKKLNELQSIQNPASDSQPEPPLDKSIREHKAALEKQGVELKKKISELSQALTDFMVKELEKAKTAFGKESDTGLSERLLSHANELRYVMISDTDSESFYFTHYYPSRVRREKLETLQDYFRLQLLIMTRKAQKNFPTEIQLADTMQTTLQEQQQALTKHLTLYVDDSHELKYYLKQLAIDATFTTARHILPITLDDPKLYIFSLIPFAARLLVNAGFKSVDEAYFRALLPELSTLQSLYQSSRLSLTRVLNRRRAKKLSQEIDASDQKLERLSTEVNATKDKVATHARADIFELFEELPRWKDFMLDTLPDAGKRARLEGLFQILGDAENDHLTREADSPPTVLSACKDLLTLVH